MNTNTIKTLILFFTGFCLYITIEVLFRGYSYPAMGICAGISILLLDQINNKISWDVDILWQGIIGSIIVTLFELIIGEYTKLSGLPAMWDYTNIPFNFDGVICLPFSLVWIVLSIIGIFIADAINYYIFDELPVPYYNLLNNQILRFKEK